MAINRCSECKAKLVCEDGTPKPAGTKTCGPKCRSARSRRIKRQQAKAKERFSKRNELPEHMKEVSEVVTRGAKDVTHEVLKEEIRPIVREQMTEQVLAGINNLIHASPHAIEKLIADVDNEDPTIAQRAYTLLLKYTMGNPSVAPPPTTPQQGGVTVVFGMPRPGDENAAIITTGDAEELRSCSDCGEERPLTEFESESNCCTKCFYSRRKLLEEKFGAAYAQ